MKAPNMDAQSISERLREVAELSDLEPDLRMAAKIDPSPGAISERLRQLSRLRAFCLRLGQVDRS